MAVLTAQGIARLAIELLTRSLVLPNTVSRVPGGEFSGSNGDTITVRVPQPGVAREQTTRGADIDFDDVYEVPVDVQLKELYHGKLTSDPEMALDIENFGRQVTRVQVAAVATKAEDQLASVMNALDVDEGSVTASNIDAKILAAREFLGENDAPAGARWLAVSPSIATILLSVDKFTKVNESGTSSALRHAVIGSLYGFTVVESNGLTTDTAVAYHQSGFVFANRIPPAVNGAVDSAVAAGGGIGLRQVLDYISTKLSHASILSTFAGAAAVYDWDFDESGEPIEESGSGEQPPENVAKRFFKLSA